jgi:spore maturation protein CgeB
MRTGTRDRMNPLDVNCALLRARWPSLAAEVREAGGGVLQIRPAKNGLPTALANGKWIHSQYDPVREASVWAEAQGAQVQAGELAVVLGIGLLYHVEALRKHMPRDWKVAAVVPSRQELHDAFGARPLGEWVTQVDWLYGSPDDIAARLSMARSPLRLLTYEPAAGLHDDFHRAIERSLRQRLAAQAGGRLHVAVVGPLYGGSLPIARYAMAALESLGHQVMWVDHSAHYGAYRVMDGLKEARHRALVQGKFVESLGLYTVSRLAEDPPDLVLALAQAPLELPILEHLNRKRFVTAMWFVENYRHLTYWRHLARGYQHWFVIQNGACREAFRQAGAQHVAYLPLAADPSVHRPLALTPEEKTEFGADVSFVGAGYVNRRRILPLLTKQSWTFKLWGNEWEGAEDLKPVLQRGGQRIETETCVKVFNGTHINLNLHSYTGEGLDPQADFVNPRTFELAACGTFQLTDHRALLPALFSENEIATFRNTEELLSQISTWLHEPEARAAMAQAARRRVLVEHTYRHRMETLLAAIGVSRPDRIGAILRGERQAGYLATHCSTDPELARWLREFPSGQRVELKEVAARIKSKGPTAVLTRDELLLLMLDEYRMETRDLF